MGYNALSNPVISSSEIILDNIETYDASMLDCYAFRRGSDVVNGHSLALGNMVSGYPFTLNGIRFENSEAAYIAGAFSNNTAQHIEIQQALCKETNGFMAKKRIRRANEAVKRADWDEFNIQWMLYVVWCKVVGNDDFRRMLLDIPSTAVIIEDSTFQNGTTATVWGTKNDCQRRLALICKRELKAVGKSKAAIDRACDQKRLNEWRTQGVFRGKNIMGKILMLCCRCIKEGTEPAIDLALLRSKNIHILGQRFTFN